MNVNRHIKKLREKYAEDLFTLQCEYYYAMRSNRYPWLKEGIFDEYEARWKKTVWKAKANNFPLNPEAFRINTNDKVQSERIRCYCEGEVYRPKVSFWDKVKSFFSRK